MISNIIKDLKSNLGKFKKTFVSHIFWEANLVANWFANNAVTRNSEMTWINGNRILVVVIELIGKIESRV